MTARIRLHEEHAVLLPQARELQRCLCWAVVFLVAFRILVSDDSSLGRELEVRPFGARCLVGHAPVNGQLGRDLEAGGRSESCFSAGFPCVEAALLERVPCGGGPVVQQWPAPSRSHAGFEDNREDT